ncbi:tRNA (adenosine(37)-N6)-threonylcarbamoyltransferase complex dimerization subunit type 1 TsaB [Altererythrobacter sp. MF3-039]|uniref:tRNA (adenosine(37)-N6)-threonylcarbamoyltransferase complex dimerization subunit type 1 TsaB n=1 Tax=Altererythrobacter sp. MF3-039 TaxID=3252901 RepID=UPI00390C77EA
MRTLAIDTATEACSVALFDGTEVIGSYHKVLGRGHAERLVPAIAGLPDKGRAERILVSLGPGSFTGVRIGIAAARSLGIAWGVEVIGYPTLAILSAEARWRYPGKSTSVAIRAGHGEIFVQDFDGDGLPENELASLPLEDAAKAAAHPVIAGSMANEVALERTHGLAADMHPNAIRALAIPAQLLTSELRPIYGREPDAKLPK